MKNDNKAPAIKKASNPLKKDTLKQFIARMKKLKGDPHYVAMGMAIGVFVSLTPTIPFHTAIALALAFALKASKPAAALGVWFSNPLTIPFFYMGCYKAGMFLLGQSAPFSEKYESIFELLNLGLKVTLAMITAGAILGIPFAFAAYFITRKIFIKIHSRKNAPA